MKKYRIDGFSVEIKEIEVEKETEKSVWIGHNRFSKRSDYYNFYDSFEDAKKALIEKSEKIVEKRKFHLERAEEFLKKVCAL